MSVSPVARQNRIAPDQVFTWRRLTSYRLIKSYLMGGAILLLHEPRHGSCTLYGFLTA
jgi:hypothetical protein